jgi:hypothetical protein
MRLGVKIEELLPAHVGRVQHPVPKRPYVGGDDPEAPPTGSISGTPGSCARQIPTSEGYSCYEENK